MPSLYRGNSSGPWHSIQWAISFDGVHFAGFHLPSKYSLRAVHHGVDDLPRHLGAALIFFFGSDLGACGHRPLRNRCVAERASSPGPGPAWGTRRCHRSVPSGNVIPAYHHIIRSITVRIVALLVIDDEVDEARAHAQGTAKRPMSGVTLPRVLEHIVRQGCPGITDFLFQKAGVPQPSAIASAFVRRDSCDRPAGQPPWGRA